MLSLANLNLFCKYHNFFDCYNTLQKKLGQRHVYHCVKLPFLLITHFKNLGIKDAHLLSFASKLFAQSYLIQDFSYSTVHIHCCLILRLYVHKVGR